MTRSGTSIGAQNGRGLFAGRCSRSRWTFSGARRSMPRSASVCVERRQHLVRRDRPDPTPARGRAAATSAGPRVAEADARAARGRRGRPACSQSALGLVEEVAAFARRARRAGSRTACRARSSSARRARRPPRGRSGRPRGTPGSGARRGAAARSRSSRSRRSRSGSFAIATRSIRYGIVSPSTVASSSASMRRDLLLVAARQVAEVALAGEAPELGRRALEARAPSRGGSAPRSARRSPRARATPCGPRSGGSTPRRDRR